MLQFNVIYTTGTAILLSRFALTLLREPACRVHLVANGCTVAEREHLARLCASHERVSFQEMPSASPLPHGTVLNHLQQECDAPHFAIIDSDIFATGPFLPSRLATELTCALPPAVYWDRVEEARQQERHRLGCTYVAIYDNALLTRLREETEIAFDKYRWETLTGEQQALLRSLNYVRPTYDTGKVLNAMMVARGTQVAFADASELRHLGGFSRSHTQGYIPLRVLRRIRQVPSLLFSPLRLWAWLQRAHRKERSSNYFGELLRALATDKPLPSLPRMGSRHIEEKMRTVSEEIIAFYA